MKNLELETEVIQIGIYSNIILNVLKYKSDLSISKITLFSYLIKKDKFKVAKIYTANNSQDVVCKAISMISGEYENYCREIVFILKAIHLLIEDSKVVNKSNLLTLCEDISFDKALYPISAFIEKAIDESNKMTDRQFMKEVTSNV